MTNAVFTQKNKAYELEVSGHANSVTSGPDIVCSACSALVYTLLYNTLALKADGKITELHTDIKEQEGYFYLKACASAESDACVKATFITIANGFLMLHEEYPKNVAFKLRTGEHLSTESITV